MRSTIFVSFMLGLVFLTACSGSLEDQQSSLSVDAVETLPAESTEIVDVVEDPVPTATEESLEVEDLPVLASNAVSECTLVSSLPDPPQEYAEIFSITEDDWVVGPEDAPVTLIEYGDFQ